MIKKFKKKPVIIEAIQWTGENDIQVMEFVGQKLEVSKPPAEAQRDQEYPDSSWQLTIPTLEDGNAHQVKHVAQKNDWIVKGVKGEFYPCKPDIFAETYEEVV